ncbi:sigma-70 family RNA polymerase sigma factor [Chitinophaga sp. MM2321]|uniref:RNA polymerase sigma factor n=1 Tax=Chitinophaga sp. MM2321 TaxID=3137178 RepID=UPI0032D57801
MLDALTDSELLSAFNQGDGKAFEVLYNRYWRMLFLHARRLLKCDEQAKDTVQDVFMMLLHKSDRIDSEKPLWPYLYTSLRNKIMNAFDHEKVIDRYAHFWHHVNLNEHELSREEILEREEDSDRQLQERIETEISLLPPKMRRAFELAKKQRLSYREISNETGTSEQTIKKQIERAMQILRSKLTLLISLFL